MREKVFFTPGDIVTLKQDVGNTPKMVVKSIDKAMDKTTEKPSLFGISCFWFTTNYELQTARFNTKDIVHCE